MATASSAVAYYEDRSRGKLIVLKIVKHLNLNGKKIGNRWSEMDESTEVTTITQMLLLILQTHSPCVFLSPFTEGSLSFFLTADSNRSTSHNPPILSHCVKEAEPVL